LFIYNLLAKQQGNQIKRRDVDVIVSSVLLEEAKEGMSLKEMFELVIPLFENPDSIFALEKLMIRCGIEEEKEGMAFSFEKAMLDIRFYSADELPKIDEESFEGITNIEYDVDCSNCEYFNNDDLISLLNE